MDQALGTLGLTQIDTFTAPAAGGVNHRPCYEVSNIFRPVEVDAYQTPCREGAAEPAPTEVPDIIRSVVC